MLLLYLLNHKILYDSFYSLSLSLLFFPVSQLDYYYYYFFYLLNKWFQWYESNEPDFCTIKTKNKSTRKERKITQKLYLNFFQKLLGFFFVKLLILMFFSFLFSYYFIIILRNKYFRTRLTCMAVSRRLEEIQVGWEIERNWNKFLIKRRCTRI